MLDFRESFVCRSTPRMAAVCLANQNVVKQKTVVALYIRLDIRLDHHAPTCPHLFSLSMFLSTSTKSNLARMPTECRPLCISAMAILQALIGLGS